MANVKPLVNQSGEFTTIQSADSIGPTDGGTGLTTFPISSLLYASAADTWAALTTINSGVLVTNSSGVPSITRTLPSGLGIADIRRTSSVTVTAAGTDASTAQSVSNDVVVCTTVASGTGIRLATASAGKWTTVHNAGANNLNVYPASGGSFDALATDAALVLAPGTRVDLYGSGTKWYSSIYNPVLASLVSGTLAAANMPAFTGGDVTSSAGSVNLSIGTGVVTLAKLANMATNSLIGRSTAGTGVPEIITIGSGLSLSSGTLSATGGGGGGMAWSTISSANVATATTNTGYIMETGGTLRTVTLPASAAAGFTCAVNANAGQVRIVSNGNTIDGVGAGNDLLLSAGDSVELVAKATGSLEIVFNNSGATGTTTGTGNFVLATSPALTGTPTAPTAAAGTNNTQIATTAYSWGVAPNASYRTIVDSSGSHVAARVAGTYGLGQSQPAAISGTGTLYPLNIIYIDPADFPTVGGLAAKLRLRVAVFVNDVAPTGNYTFGLHPVTRPATSGGAAVAIFTIGAAVAGSTVALNTPAADSSNNVVGSDFAVPTAGFYVIGFVSTATVATSSHMHISAALQMRNA